MDTMKPVVCIFPHGQKDFASTEELVEFLKWTLPSECLKGRQGKYHLRSLRRARRFAGKSFIHVVTVGSLVLFKKLDRIWGTATVQKAIEKLEPPEILKWIGEDGSEYEGTFHYAVYFYPQMVVYDRGVLVGAVEKATDVDLTSGFLKASYLVLGYRDEIEPRLREIMDLPKV